MGVSLPGVTSVIGITKTLLSRRRKELEAELLRALQEISSQQQVISSLKQNLEAANVRASLLQDQVNFYITQIDDLKEASRQERERNEDLHKRIEDFFYMHKWGQQIHGTLPEPPREDPNRAPEPIHSGIQARRLSTRGNLGRHVQRIAQQIQQAAVAPDGN